MIIALTTLLTLLSQTLLLQTQAQSDRYPEDPYDDYVSTKYHKHHPEGNRGTDSKIFNLVTISAGYFALFCLALCIASGLYLLAEVAEEYSSLSRRILRVSALGTLAVHAVFLLVGVSPKPLLVGAAANGCYLLLLPEFPYVEVSPTSISAVALLLANHYYWFQFFSVYYVPMFQITGFFMGMVWLVPVGFFVSMSMGDDVLPSGVGGVYHGQAGGKKTSVFKIGVGKVFDLKEASLRNSSSSSSSKSKSESVYYIIDNL